MKRALAIIFTAFSLGGCAVPVPLQVASWALDGLSYITTQKSVTDHGISMVTQKDCALFRGITEGEVCREWENSRILIADAFEDNPIMPVSIVKIASTSASVVESITLNELQVNQSRGVTSRSMSKMSVSSVVNSKYLAPDKRQSSPVTAKVDLPILAVKSIKGGQLSSIRSHEPTSGIYWVIGSFRNYKNALLLVENYEHLMPEVLAAKPGVKSVYRVVVGPIIAGQERKLHSRVFEAGLRNVWAIRIKEGDWFVARKFQAPDHSKPDLPSEELARLPK